MSTRTELPWPAIQSEIISAIDTCNEQRPFVSTHIMRNQGNYPNIIDHTHTPTRHRTVLSRVSMSLNKHNWEVYSRHSSKGGNRTYIDARYREQ